MQSETRARRYFRRVFSIPMSLLLAPLMLVLSPLVIPLLVLIDTFTGAPRRLPLARVGLMAIAFACHEWYALVLYVRAMTKSGEQRVTLLEEGMGTWSMSLIRWAGLTMGAKLDWGDLSQFPSGHLIVLSRHASNVDAIIPSALFPHLLQRPAHYVLKRELRWICSMDLFGPPLGNYFVARGGHTGSELAKLRTLGEHVRPEGALVIFPEGTFPTPASRQRIRASLARRNETKALALNDELHALLPPKPAGVQALLRARPDARPMIVAHRGLDGVAGMAGLRAKVPLRDPVVVRWWPTEPVPSGDEAQESWLQNEWLRLDRWVTSGSMDPSPDAPEL